MKNILRNIALDFYVSIQYSSNIQFNVSNMPNRTEESSKATKPLIDAATVGLRYNVLAAYQLFKHKATLRAERAL